MQMFVECKLIAANGFFSQGISSANFPLSFVQQPGTVCLIHLQHYEHYRKSNSSCSSRSSSNCAQNVYVAAERSRNNLTLKRRRLLNDDREIFGVVGRVLFSVKSVQLLTCAQQGRFAIPSINLAAGSFSFPPRNFPSHCIAARSGCSDAMKFYCSQVVNDSRRKPLLTGSAAVTAPRCLACRPTSACMRSLRIDVAVDDCLDGHDLSTNRRQVQQTTSSFDVVQRCVTVALGAASDLCSSTVTTFRIPPSPPPPPSPVQLLSATRTRLVHVPSLSLSPCPVIQCSATRRTATERCSIGQQQQQQQLQHDVCRDYDMTAAPMLPQLRQTADCTIVWRGKNEIGLPSETQPSGRVFSRTDSTQLPLNLRRTRRGVWTPTMCPTNAVPRCRMTDSKSRRRQRQWRMAMKIYDERCRRPQGTTDI